MMIFEFSLVHAPMWLIDFDLKGVPPLGCTVELTFKV